MTFHRSHSREKGEDDGATGLRPAKTPAEVYLENFIWLKAGFVLTPYRTNWIISDVHGCLQSLSSLPRRMKNGIVRWVMNFIENFGENMTSIKSVAKKSEIIPTLSKVLKFLGRLPREGIFMGLGVDKLPVLLNAHAREACNIVVWNKLARQGLRILKVMSEYIFLHRSESDRVEFVVLTRYSEDWGELNDYGMGMSGTTSCIGIIPFQSELAEQVIHGLSRWINENHNFSKAPVIVFVDGLENLSRLSESFRQDFRYILLQGYKKNVYVVGTSSKSHFSQVQNWLEGFQMEIYGCKLEPLFEYERDNKKIYFMTPETEMI